MRQAILITITGILIGLLAAGCGSDATSPAGIEISSAPGILFAKSLPEFPPDPGGFVAEIDNAYLGFERGKTLRYEGETEDGFETTIVEVTEDTKTILGVSTTVVRDRVYLEGELIEDTFDWYAQDVDGNVWYFGEDSKEYENGIVVSTEGSWEAGVDGAMPGIIMLAEPVIGTKYHQEFAEDVAEDMAKVLSLKKEVEVPYGSFGDCLMTQEWTPLDPGAREFKYYAPGVGLVLELQPRGGRVRVELVAVED